MVGILEIYILTICAAMKLDYIYETNNLDPELTLVICQANKLLPEFLVGVVLAGIFAAAMSTADSQILSCTASITNDIFTDKKIVI